MENKSDLIVKLIKEAKKNGFRFGNFIKAPDGFRFYDFEVTSYDFGYCIELTYTKSVPSGSEHNVIYFDFASLLLSKMFMKKLLDFKGIGESKYFDIYSIILVAAHNEGINSCISLLIELLNL